MKRWYNLLGALLLSTVTSGAMAAGTVVFEQHFDTEADFNSMTTTNADIYPESTEGQYRCFWRYNSYSGYAYIYIYSGDPQQNDDYITTPAIALDSTKAYKLSSRFGAYSSSYGDASARILVGQGDDPSAFTELYSNPAIAYVSFPNVQPQELLFKVPETGDYSVSFHCNGPNLILDDIIVTELGDAGAPAAVTGLTVTPGADDALAATISFTTPTKSLVGEDLTDLLKVEIYRGEELVNTINNAPIGATLSWTDTNAPAGTVTYTVVAYVGDIKGMDSSASAYVGPDTPKAVKNLAVAKSATGCTITWTAETVGINGTELSNLSFDVYRVVGEEETLIANVTENQYVDTYSPEALCTVSYKVVAKNGAMASDAVVSDALLLGFTSLPFEDSFAGKVMNEYWTVTSSSTTYKWNARAFGEKRYDVGPYDADGGLLSYNSYSASNGSWSRLITPPLKMSSAEDPAVTFMIHHNTSNSSSNDRIVIEVSQDGGDFVEVPNSTFTRYAATAGWERCTVSLADYKAAGTVQVAVKAVSGYGTELIIDAVSVKDIAGPDTPQAVSDLQVSYSGNDFTVTWTAPEKGVMGGTINADDLTYNVYRIVDGEETQIKENYARTQVVDTYEPVGLQTIQYKVVACAFGLQSAAATSQTLDIGSLPLPFNDSFANKTMNEYWTNVAYSGSKIWELKSMGSSPNADPVDTDGGMLMYNSFSASSGQGARLITPPLNIASAAAPVAEFWFYHSSSGESSEDKMTVEISVDGGDFTEIPSATYLRYSETSGWVKYAVSLTEYKASTSIKLAFNAHSGYGLNMYLDNISIYSREEHDMQANSLTGVETVFAGNTVTYTLSVSNIGAQPVAAGDYQVDLYKGEEVIATVDGIALEPEASGDITFDIPYDASNIGNTYTYHAEIIYRADANGDNNTSNEVSTTVAEFGGPKVTDLHASIFENQNVHLTWSAAYSSDGVEPVNILDNFDSYTALTYDSQLGSFKNVDADGLTTSSWFSSYIPTDPKGFFVFSPKFINTTSSLFNAKSSANCLVAKSVTETDATADDWLISPELPAQIENVFSFYVRSGGSSSDKGQFVIECSTTDDETASFTPLCEAVTVTGTSWKQYTYTLPVGTKYVALRHVSPSTVNAGAWWGIMVDDVAINGEVLNLIGYNIYCNGKKMNDTPVVDLTYNDIDKAKGNLVYHVSVVYEEGETGFSNPASVIIAESGVGAMDANATKVVVRGRTVTSYFNGNIVESKVYNAAGALVAIGDGTVQLPAAGIYFVENQSKKIAKIIVK